MQKTSRKKIRKLLIANLLMFGVYFHADAFIIMGARPCGIWVQNAEEAGWPRSVQEAWLMGYLSGLVITLERDVLKDTSAPSLILWVNNYCKNNPLDRSDQAGDKLFFELKKRAGV